MTDEPMTREHFEALLDRACEKLNRKHASEIRDCFRQYFDTDPVKGAAVVRALAGGETNSLIADTASDMVRDYFDLLGQPRREDHGDGLDGVEHDGVRLPRAVQVRHGFGKAAIHATVVDLRVHARFLMADPAMRKAAAAWIAVASRMEAAGAGPDAMLVDAARLLT